MARPQHNRLADTFACAHIGTAALGLPVAREDAHVLVEPFAKPAGQIGVVAGQQPPLAHADGDRAKRRCHAGKALPEQTIAVEHSWLTKILGDLDDSARTTDGRVKAAVMNLEELVPCLMCASLPHESQLGSGRTVAQTPLSGCLRSNLNFKMPSKTV